MADGGVCATLRDLGRFGQLFATGGLAGDGDSPEERPAGSAGDRAVRQRVPSVVPSDWVRDTIAGAPDGPRAFVAAGDAPGFPAGAHYRNCWWVREPAVPFFHASGINGQNVFVHVPTQTVVAKLSTWPTALSSKIRVTTDAARAIAEALGSGHI
jgi:CubicO group peptidase (beta-lactamase class C family)